MKTFKEIKGRVYPFGQRQILLETDRQCERLDILDENYVVLSIMSEKHPDNKIYAERAKKARKALDKFLDSVTVQTPKN